MELPDFDRLRTPEQVETEMKRRKDTVCSKVKQKEQVEQQKKDTNASFREVLKQINEEINFEIEVIDRLNARLNEVAGQ